MRVCYADSTVSGMWHGGGLVGRNNWFISNCYASGIVTGTDMSGGLVGWNNGTISNCYAAGAVSGTSSIGGLVGYASIGTYIKNFWDTTVNPALTGIANISDPLGVIGESTVNLQIQSTFTDAGWDFC